MGAGGLVLGAIKAVGTWVINNPNMAFDAVDKVAKIQADKKAIGNEEHLAVVEEKVNQLGAATLELDQKINAEISLIRKQLRMMKIILAVVGAMSAAVVAIFLLALL